MVSQRTTHGRCSPSAEGAQRSFMSRRNPKSAGQSPRTSNGSARTSWPTLGRPGGRSSGSTATLGSRRTRARTRPTRGSSSATSSARTRTRPLLPSPPTEGGVRRRRDLASRRADSRAYPRRDRSRPEGLARRKASGRAVRARRRQPRAGTGRIRPRASADRRPEAQGLHLCRAIVREDVCAPGFVDELAALCREASPLVRFLCAALDAPF
jgi:hypothetical protein